MKFTVATILTALLVFIAGLYLPWWSLAVMALLVALLVHQHPGKAFLSAFVGVFLLWAGLAWWIDMKNDGVLSAKMAKLLPVGGSVVVLILLTAVVGALVAGLGALSGSFLRASGAKRR
jgi:hypothetical protein